MADTTQATPPPVIDSSKYIRTYAKDLAAISATLTPEELKKGKVAAAIKEVTPLPPPAPKKVPSHDLLRQQALEPEPRQDPNKPFELPAIAVGDLKQGNVAPPPPTSLEQEVADIVPQTTDTTIDRQSVLARLKAKAASRSSMMPQGVVVPAAIQPSISDPIPQPPVPAPKVQERPLPPRPAPAPSPLPKVELPPAPPPLPSSLASVAAVEKPIPEEPSPIHTFKSDFSDHIDEVKANKFSVLAAEKDATRTRRVAPKRPSLVLPITTGALLILVGLGAAYAGYRLMSAQAPVSITPTITASVVPDNRIALTPRNGSYLSALAAQVSQAIPTNAVVQTYLNATSTGLLPALALPAPDILFRNTDPMSTVGIVHANDETRAFFILNVSSYERTFAGMLQWEPTLPYDLAILYPVYTHDSTASSTAPDTSGFIDEVIASHNARAYKDGSGKTVLIYGYASPTKLIIARNEAAFQLLLTRLQANNQ